MSVTVIKFSLESANQSHSFGSDLSKLLAPGYTIYLQGNLGAGKTTLTQGILKGLGFSGAVKSPTYSLIETYEVELGHIAHIDLYRMQDPEELEFMGIRDYFDEQQVCIVEWAEKARNYLPEPDIHIKLEQSENHPKRYTADILDKLSTGVLSIRSDRAKQRFQLIKVGLEKWAS